MEEGVGRWLIPKTTKLSPFDIRMPMMQTTLPSGLVVTFKPEEQLNPHDLERWIGIYRTVCFGTRMEIWGFACIANELLATPLTLAEVEDNRVALHNLFLPIIDSLDDRTWGSNMITRPYDELEHENFLFAHFWRSWHMAVRSAIEKRLIGESVRLTRMSELLVEYAESPEVLYKWHQFPEGQMVALPVWIRNWFHHTENSLEPIPPSRHEIRRASGELMTLSAALEMSKQERRAETHREESEQSTTIEYAWLNMVVYMNERRDLFWVYQRNVFSGWRAEVKYSKYIESGQDLVDFALKLKRKAMKQQDS